MLDAQIKIPVFSIRAVDVRAKADGRPLFLVIGEYPPWQDLLDWRLVVWVEAPDKLVFGGAHPGMIPDGKPIIEFFRVADAVPAIQGWVDAAIYQQVAFMNDNGEPERLFYWTFISAEMRRGEQAMRSRDLDRF